MSSLSKILEPLGAEEFLASSWGANLAHVRGGAGKFARLMPWEHLNEILHRHRLDFPRVRLVRDGDSVPVASYLRYIAGGRRKTPVPRLKSTELQRQLREGATLVLDAVDELQEPIEELAAGLELFFREHVQVNMYAGWQTSRGFDLHWDDHDVFILQVAGRKRWSVYGETRPHPLVNDVERAEKPTHAPLWEGTLEDGDLLYIPRGWWHVAVPLAEPTLHLTVGVHNRNGLDLLRWFAERMRASDTFRRDLPRFSSAEERASHLSQMREELVAAFADKLDETYFAERDAQAESRARVSLPWAATPSTSLPGPRALVRLLAPRPLQFETCEGASVVEFTAIKRRWRFAADALHVLRPLEERRACTVAELCEAARGRLEEATVRAFVSELTLHGLVSVSEG